MYKELTWILVTLSVLAEVLALEWGVTSPASWEPHACPAPLVVKNSWIEVRAQFCTWWQRDSRTGLTGVL